MSDLINENNNENENIEEIILFLNRINIILNKICFHESQNELIDQNAITFLIITNKKKEFLLIMKNFSNIAIYKKIMKLNLNNTNFTFLKQ